MVKLIVTDLDGCLFDGKGNLPSGQYWKRSGVSWTDKEG